jgi:hypothetical protein
MADRVNTTMESMQPPSADGPSDCTLRVAERPQQLTDGNNAMLTFGHLRQGAVRRPCFSPS